MVATLRRNSVFTAKAKQRCKTPPTHWPLTLFPQLGQPTIVNVCKRKMRAVGSCQIPTKFFLLGGLFLLPSDEYEKKGCMGIVDTTHHTASHR